MKKLLLFAASLSPSSALAHPGHGTLSDPVMHALGEPVHALPVIGGIGVAAIATVVVGRLAARRARLARARTRR